MWLEPVVILALSVFTSVPIMCFMAIANLLTLSPTFLTQLIFTAHQSSGEYLVQQTTARSLILRISSVFGKAGASGKGGNFVETMIKKAKSGDPIRVVNDILMSPTYTYDAARLLDVLLQEGATGLIHGANSGSCSWYEFASTALRLANIQYPIEAIPASDFPTLATRPMNSALISDQLPKITNFQMRPWQEALAAYIQAR